MAQATRKNAKDSTAPSHHLHGLREGALFVLGAYRGVWQYFSVIDGVTFAKAVFAGTVLSELIVLYLYRFESYSRTVFIIYAVVIFILLSASRASFRLIDEFATRRRKLGDRLVVYGAGPGGSLAVRTVANLDTPYRVVGFVDANPNRQRVRVQGYPVMGTFERLRQLITNKQVDAVLVSTDAIDSDCLAEAETLAAQHGVRVLQLQVRIQHREELRRLDPSSPPPAPSSTRRATCPASPFFAPSARRPRASATTTSREVRVARCSWRGGTTSRSPHCRRSGAIPTRSSSDR